MARRAYTCTERKCGVETKPDDIVPVWVSNLLINWGIASPLAV
jgi:hypothetical protein